MQNKRPKKSKSAVGVNLSQTIKNLPLKKVIYFSVGLAALNIILVLILNRHLPPEVPLFYGLPEGEGQLTNTNGLMIAGFFSLAVIILNTTFAIISKNEFIQKTLILSEFVVAFMSIFTTIEIILLVGVF